MLLCRVVIEGSGGLQKADELWFCCKGVNKRMCADVRLTAEGITSEVVLLKISENLKSFFLGVFSAVV